MTSEIKINFYDEILTLKIDKKPYIEFKSEIAKKYGVNTTDVDEFISYYFDPLKIKYFLRNEDDYNLMIDAMKKFSITLFLEIHEESKLFKQQTNNLNSNNNLTTNIPITTNNNAFSEKLKNEILEKERLLKETIQREKVEIQRKKEEIKKKLDDEHKKKKLEELRKKKLLAEQENEELRKKEKNELENQVSKLMTDNIELIKKTLIDNTINQSVFMLDKQKDKRLQMSQSGNVHNNITCSGCGVSPIVGIRFSCGIVNDFHLCESCEFFLGSEHPYPLLKYYNTNQAKSQIKLVLEETDNNEFMKNFNKDFNNSCELTEEKPKEESFILIEELNKMK